MTHLTLDGVTKLFHGPAGPITAVDTVNIAVNEGEFLVLVGPSGCGKTTTLRMIAGLDIPDEGTIIIGDRDVTRLEPDERDIAMVFQNYALYPHKTVRGNISYGLRKSTTLSDEEIESQVTEIAELMDIADLLEKKPAQLSGGQKQRVATGRALVRDPAVFLLDEPLSNLDAKLRLHMRTEIQRIQSEFNTTAVYVTHDQEEALTMGDKIAVMQAGTLQQVGTPAEIYDRPRNRFVAEFVGNPSMNFFEAVLTNEILVGEGIQVDLVRGSNDIADGRYVVGIRPENVEIDRETSDRNRATVSVVEPIGSEAIVYLNLESTEITAKLPREEAPSEGEMVSVVLPETGIYLFDADTDSLVYIGRSGETSEVATLE